MVLVLLLALPLGCATSGSAPPGQDLGAGASGGATTARAETPTAQATPSEPVRPVPLPSCPAPGGTSRLWTDFVAARKAGREPVLPDFSYAGYRDSNEPLPDIEARVAQGPVFRVTDFGAVPDDGQFDDAGIQAAIDAASERGGVVLFPPGRFQILSDGEARGLSIRAPNVVLKGSPRPAPAAGPGTEIVAESPRPGRFFLRIRPPDDDDDDDGNDDGNGDNRRLAEVVAPAPRESLALMVADASKLKAGDWVVVAGGGSGYNQFHWGRLWPFPQAWSRMHRTGNRFEEIHQVATVEGKVVVFTAPLHVSVRPAPDSPFVLRAKRTLAGIGLEDLRFVGRWDTYPEAFSHHKDGTHDGGWSGVSFSDTVDSFVRRCEFHHFNQSLHVSDSARVTLTDLVFSGKKGHTSIHTRGGYGILIRDSVDLAGHHHGPGLGYWGTGTVYLRHRMLPDQRIDSHSGSPYANLYDQALGGVLSGNGGPQPGLPHHGRHLVFWNFQHRSKEAKSYDFWSTQKRINNTFALPIFAGFQSATPVTFLDEKNKVQANESFGRPVSPPSLFEAQLAWRTCRPPPAAPVAATRPGL